MGVEPPTCPSSLKLLVTSVRLSMLIVELLTVGFIRLMSLGIEMRFRGRITAKMFKKIWWLKKCSLLAAVIDAGQIIRKGEDL